MFIDHVSENSSFRRKKANRESESSGAKVDVLATKSLKQNPWIFDRLHVRFFPAIYRTTDSCPWLPKNTKQMEIGFIRSLELLDWNVPSVL